MQETQQHILAFWNFGLPRCPLHHRRGYPTHRTSPVPGLRSAEPAQRNGWESGVPASLPCGRQPVPALSVSKEGHCPRPTECHCLSGGLRTSTSCSKSASSATAFAGFPWVWHGDHRGQPWEGTRSRERISMKLGRAVIRRTMTYRGSSASSAPIPVQELRLTALPLSGQSYRPHSIPLAVAF
jgi:hypothetical protein